MTMKWFLILLAHVLFFLQLRYANKGCDGACTVPQLQGGAPCMEAVPTNTSEVEQ